MHLSPIAFSSAKGTGQSLPGAQGSPGLLLAFPMHPEPRTRHSQRQDRQHHTQIPSGDSGEGKHFRAPITVIAGSGGWRSPPAPVPQVGSGRGPTYWTVPIGVVVRDVNCKLEHAVLVESMPYEDHSKPHCRSRWKRGQGLAQSSPVCYKQNESWSYLMRSGKTAARTHPGASASRPRCYEESGTQ